MASKKKRIPRRKLSARRPKESLLLSLPPPRKRSREAKGVVEPPLPPRSDVPDMRTWSTQFAQPVSPKPTLRGQRELSSWAPPPPAVLNAESISSGAPELVKVPEFQVNALVGEGSLGADAIVIPAQYREMLRHVTAIEEALTALSRLRAGIGDNRPPEPIELDGFDSKDQRVVEAAISTVKALPPSPAMRLGGAQEAAAELARIGTKTKEYAVRQGDNFISEIVKAAALGTATMAGAALWDRHPLDYVLYLLADRLLSAADAIQAWVDLFGSLR